MSAGHIYRKRLKDGRRSRWHAVIDLPPLDGRRWQQTKTFDTKREAEQWIAEQTTARRNGTFDQLLWDEFLPRWLAGKLGIRPSTAVSYRAHIDRYLLPEFGKVPVTGLDAQMVQDWHHRLLEQGLSAATVRRVHATLSSAAATAMRQGRLERNPLSGVELPAVARSTQRVWTACQAQEFLRHTATDPLAALWRLALISGLRRGELLELRRSDVDLQRRILQVRSNRVLVGDRTVVGAPKSRSSRRIVILDETTALLLRRHISGATVVPIRSTDARGEWLFVDSAGDPISPAWLSRRFTELVHSSGLPVIRFHDLRHTSATLGQGVGEELKAISARLGHSSVTITGDMYVQVPLPAARAHASRLADALQPASTPVASDADRLA